MTKKQHHNMKATINIESLIEISGLPAVLIDKSGIITNIYNANQDIKPNTGDNILAFFKTKELKEIKSILESDIDSHLTITNKTLHIDKNVISADKITFIPADKDNTQIAVLFDIKNKAEIITEKKCDNYYEERWTLINKASNDGFFDWDFVRNSFYYSDQLLSLLMLNKENLPKDIQGISKLFTPNGEDTLLHLYSSKSIPEVLELEEHILCATGEPRWFRIKIASLFNDENIPHRMSGLVSDITDHKVYEKEIYHKATHDQLTGLPNRMHFYDRLRTSLSEAERNGSKVAILFFDLDNFKGINDHYGHGAGDQVLYQVAEKVSKTLRPHDLFARLGGDEFAIILPLKNIASAKAIAKRILDVFTRPFLVQEKLHDLSTSIGISLYPENGLDADLLLHKADIAMYWSKNHGKKQATVWEDEMESLLDANIKRD